MDKRLSDKWAKINVIAIGIFYIVSGIWEYLVGLTQEESISSGVYFLLDIYRNYAINLGLITILIGICLLFRAKLIRLAAIILAWWNLFTVPIIGIWWPIYAISIKKFSITNSWFALWIYSIILIFIMTAVRLYIIYVLSMPRAGSIFLKKGWKNT